MSNYHRGIATNIILLILAGLLLLGGATVGVVTFVQKNAEPQCEGSACPSATSTVAFPEPDWTPRAPDVCGDNVCGPDETSNPSLCPSDCETKEAPTGPLPTITFTAKPTSLPSSGGTAVLTWSTKDATSCASSATPGKDSTWFFAGAPSGTVYVSLGSTSKTYTLTCVGPGGSAQKSVAITVAPTEKKKVVYTPTYKAPTLTLSPTSAKISYGKTVPFSWKTTYATSCKGSGPWSDTTFGTSDTKYTAPLLESAVLEITCIGQGGSVTKKAAVTVAEAKGCYLGTGTVANGASATAYQSSSVKYGETCASEIRTCTNGSLSGSYLYTSCKVADASSCVTPWYETVKDGATVTAYQSSSVAYGGTCTSETRTCSNGTLSGSFTKSSCEVAEAKGCYFSSAGTVPNGSSVTAYQTSSVAYGKSCTSETRTCDNGTLSGTYTYSSCTAGEAKDCSSSMLGTVTSGSSITAYQSSSVAYGQTCASETRACSNGTLSGTYTYSSCAQGAPGAPTITLTPAQTSIAYGGSTVIDWSVENATSPTCTGAGGWSGKSFTGKSGSEQTGTLITSTSFGLNCTGDGGKTASKTVTITVGAAKSCTTPWGTTVGNNGTATGWSLVVAPYELGITKGSSCNAKTYSKTQACNGTTGFFPNDWGSYTKASCIASGPATCTTSHAKGYTCTILQTSANGYRITCPNVGETKHGECRDTWGGLTGENQCNTWPDKGWKVSLADGKYRLTTIGKENNHSSPAWTTKTCDPKVPAGDVAGSYWSQ